MVYSRHKMNTLDQMQAFVEVVERGSFTAAALSFDISPTAMSKKVAMLEKSLNTRLLIRTPRLIAMTEIGKKYYAQCKKVLHEYELSHLLIEEKDNYLSGTLNIVCRREVAQKLVYPSMANFLAYYPHIVSNVTLKKSALEIVLNDFDIAIGYEPVAIFNDWCSKKINGLLFYYPNIKPLPLKIKVYRDYLAEKISTIKTEDLFL